MGRWQAAGLTEGNWVRPAKPSASISRAKRFRREPTKPELMLWQLLRQSPGGHKFRKQHPAGPYILDFFCARANLAIEVDGFAHDTGDRPERDGKRDAWLAEHRIDTLRIPAVDVLKDAVEVTNVIVATVGHRLDSFGKAPPSSLRDATSPSQVDGEE
ncbi:MAG: endonuclease domain-containing protein [Sphingorhabdus sp.]